MVKIVLITFIFLPVLLFGKNSLYSENGNEPWGKDSDLVTTITPSENPSYSFPNKACQSMIRFFQVFISPIDGPRSSYYPSSSQYTLLAIQKYGILQGICLGCDRLLRENHDPWYYNTIALETRTLKHDPVR